jgi:flavodoxin
MSTQLVTYYSWTGNTAKVAKALAVALSADIEQIREVKPRGGLFAFIRSAIEGRRRRTVPILASTRDAGAYDLVLLGGPVWAGEIASPLRSYIDREKGKLKQVAFFCTLGGANGASALASMGAACGRQPVAELLIDAASLQSGAWRMQVDEFAKKLRTPAAAPATA